MLNTLNKLFNIKKRQAFGYHRYPLNPFKEKPDFIIIGSQKAATTSLHYLLGTHPRLIPSILKETHYYNMNIGRGNQYYLSCFPLKKNNQLSFETTPDYIDHPSVPELLYLSKPETKLIITIRDPVQRAFSHFNMVQSYNSEERKISFREGLKLEDLRIKNAYANIKIDPYNSARHLSNYSYRTKGHYADFVEKWLEYFPLNQIHFMEFEEIISNNVEAYDELFKFLDVEKLTLQPIPKINVTKYNSKMDEDIKNELAEYYKPYNEKLFNIIRKKYDWK